MHSVVRWVVLFGTLAAIGCDDASDCVNCPPTTPYLSATSPENQIKNIEVAYRERDCQGYAKLLAPEFKFRFQPLDAAEIGVEFWGFVPDSVGTCALLNSPEVSDIRIDLTYGSRDSSVDTFPPVDSLRVPVNTTDLQIEQTDGTTWVITDRQDFFFRQGQVERGEDPSHWLIYEWDDLPSVVAPNLMVRPATWGRMKMLFESAE